MTDTPEIDGELATLFAAARSAPPEVSEDLLRRVVADAGRVQRESPEPARIAAARGGWFRQFSRAIGGWAGMGGLVAACAAGLWLGVSPPDGWVDPVSLVMSSYSTESTLYMFDNTGFYDLLAQEEGL